MENKNTSITGYIQAGVAILSALGIVGNPESVSMLSAGAIAVMGVLSAIKGHFTKDK